MNHLTVEAATLTCSETRLWQADGLYLVRLARATSDALNPHTDARLAVRWGVEHDGRMLEWFDRRKDALRLVSQIVRSQTSTGA